MKQTEQNVRKVLHQNLDRSSYDGAFSNIWASHLGKSTSRIRFRKAALMPMVIVLTLLALCTVGYAGLSRLTDNIDLPFVDDPRVIGKWETVDFVEKTKDFDPDSKSFEDELYLTNLVFLPSGKMLDTYENGNLFYSGSTWTKDTIITPEEQIASKYEIKEINGIKYMFMEWKNGDYTLRFMKPNYYVLKQVDTNDYSNFAPTKIEDPINYEFVDNPEMVGLWKSVDFVDKMDDFEMGKRQYEGNLYVKELNILQDGKLSFKYMDDTIANTELSWTGDLILNHGNKTAGKCTIREIEGQTYMFFEWKTSDYVYRGMKPNYYVFMKSE